VNYVTKDRKNNIMPQILELQQLQDDAYEKWLQAKRITLTDNLTPENIENRAVLHGMYSIAEEKCEEMKCLACALTLCIKMIYNKINDINKHIYKNYKKCSHCEKKKMVTSGGCKSKHNLCSECSDDITECPVCKEDLGLQYCAICMENKKKMVETGCENKHQTCKECLDKIIRRNHLCPFCRDDCSSKEPIKYLPSYYLMDNGEDIRYYLQDRADDRRERY